MAVTAMNYAPVRLRPSDRIMLKQFEVGDAAALFQLVQRNRTHLGRRLTWVKHYLSLADSEAFIAHAAEVATTNGAPTCGIWFDGQLVGTMSFHPINHATEVALMGYWIAESAQGQGIVTAAAKELIRYGFDTLGLQRIEIVCAPDNASSQAIAQKLGFIREAKTQIAVWQQDPTAQMIVFARERLT